VPRVADGARRDGESPLGAELLGGASEVGEHVAHARDREGEELAALVDALAEPRDPRLAVELLHEPVCDVGDEEPGRVGAEVDGGDAHAAQASRGYTGRTPRGGAVR